MLNVFWEPSPFLVSICQKWKKKKETEDAPIGERLTYTRVNGRAGGGGECTLI